MSYVPSPPPAVPPPPPGVRWTPPPETGGRFFVRWLFIVLGIFVMGSASAGTALVFAIIAAIMAPSRGRRKDTAFNYGIWWSFFYVIYLAFQPRQ